MRVKSGFVLRSWSPVKSGQIGPNSASSKMRPCCRIQSAKKPSFFDLFAIFDRPILRILISLNNVLGNFTICKIYTNCEHEDALKLRARKIGSVIFRQKIRRHNFISFLLMFSGMKSASLNLTVFD